jgi:hypothetical protein
MLLYIWLVSSLCPYKQCFLKHCRAFICFFRINSCKWIRAMLFVVHVNHLEVLITRQQLVLWVSDGIWNTALSISFQVMLMLQGCGPYIETQAQIHHKQARQNSLVWQLSAGGRFEWTRPLCVRRKENINPQPLCSEPPDSPVWIFCFHLRGISERVKTSQWWFFRSRVQ